MLFTAPPLAAHRVDEYLQASTVLVSSGRLRLAMRLAPGMLVSRTVLDSIDLDGDDILSLDEQRRYGQRVIRDLDVTLDAVPIALTLDSTRFDDIAMLRDGTGTIVLTLGAALPPGSDESTHRRLVVRNRHRPAISVYLVNSLQPEDSRIHIERQERDYRQSVYELLFVEQRQPGMSAALMTFWLVVLTGFAFAAGDWIRQRLAR